MQFSNIIALAATLSGVSASTSYYQYTTIETSTICESTVSYCPGRNESRNDTVPQYIDAAAPGVDSTHLYTFGTVAVAALGVMLL